MTQEHQPSPIFCTQIDVSSELESRSPASPQAALSDMCYLMQGMLAAQHRHNELLEELVGHITTIHRQRTQELATWKHANPELAKYCKSAADKLGKVQTDLLASITSEVEEEYETFMDSEYMLGDFVDKYGPRFGHLNGLLQVLAQLGNAPDISPSQVPHAK